MHRLLVATLFAAAEMTAASADGGMSPTIAALFPQAAEVPTVTAGTVVLRPSPKSTIKLTPVRFVPRTGISQYHDTHFCGVVLADRAGKRQGLVTVGVGYTETLTCAGLAAAGLAPAARPGAVRIGLIYETGTLRSSLRTPVVLVLDPATSRWSVDDAATEAMDLGRPAYTIAQLRRKLPAIAKR